MQWSNPNKRYSLLLLLQPRQRQQLCLVNTVGHIIPKGKSLTIGRPCRQSPSKPFPTKASGKRNDLDQLWTTYLYDIQRLCMYDIQYMVM